MKLYYSPLACSLATRIVLAEAGRDATFMRVDPATKTTADGRDFRQVHPLGLVPTLETDDGSILSENFAVLIHAAQGTPLAAPAQAGELRRWLGFIGTELHKGVFSVFFDPAANDAVRDYALNNSGPRLSLLDEHLQGRQFLLDDFSAADAYLLTILNWAQVTPIDLQPWPAVRAYLERGLSRPSVRDAIALELPLYLEERQRHRERRAAPAPSPSPASP